MNNNIILNNKKYKLIKNNNEAYDEKETQEKCTDYFEEFDYIVGDYSYGMLRLKGFYNSQNKRVKTINNYQNIDKYLKENCSYGCKYFVLEKILN